MEVSLNKNYELLSEDKIREIIQQVKTEDSLLEINNLDNIELAKFIDHTLLKPDASVNDIKKLCDEAKEFGFYSVCVNPIWVDYCFNYLKETDVRVCTVIGFPLGSNKTEIKIREAEIAIEDGAEELDMVINIGKLKSTDYSYVFNDIKFLAELTKKYHILLKVIIETCLLTDEEKVIVSSICKQAGADFVKTSTGFSIGGANLYDVKLMKLASENLRIKASGGIKSRTDALRFIAAGASRLGTSSGVKIIKDEIVNSGY
jgi:deoxyribose-phosphate aldolase